MGKLKRAWQRLRQGLQDRIDTVRKLKSEVERLKTDSASMDEIVVNQSNQIDALIRQAGAYENEVSLERERLLNLIECLVFRAGGRVVLNEDLVDAVVNSDNVLKVDNADGGGYVVSLRQEELE